MKSMCKNKEWYGKGTQRMIRHLMRRMNNGPSDGKTDLQVCVPSIAVNIETDGLNGLKRFLPEAVCSTSNDPVCQEAKQNPLVRSSGGSIDIRGLESTDRKACAYQLLNQFKQQANGKWSMKAETGRSWLTTKIKISPKFRKSACTQPAAIRTAIITKLKENDYDLWQDLEPRHVLVQCKGYNANKDNRLRRLSKDDASRMLEENQELSISIQLSDKQKANNGIAETKESIGTPAAMAETLAGAGVTDITGKPISSSDVIEVEVASTTSNEIEVEKLPDDIASTIGDEKEKTTKKEILNWVIIGIAIGVGVLCICLCAAFFVYKMLCGGIKNNNAVQSNKTVTVMATDVSGNAVTVTALAQAVPVPVKK